MSRYYLYVVDDRGRSMVILDSHNSQGNRIWVLPDDQPFSIVLEHNTMKTFLMMDEDGELVIEQEPAERPKPPPKPRRRSRYWKRYGR